MITKRKQSKVNVEASFIISLIIHFVLAIILAFVVLDFDDTGADEFVAVQMINTAKNIAPPRRLETRNSIARLGDPTERKIDKPSSPRRMEVAGIDTAFVINDQVPDTSLDQMDEISTHARDLKSRFDMSVPKPTGAVIKKPGTGEKRSRGKGTGAGSIGLPDGAGIFETALYNIARDLVGKNKTGREDIVFLVDASGSMEENIEAVARYISKMIEVFQESDLDYTMGIISFNRVLKNDNIEIYEQTSQTNEIRSILRSIHCDGDERTFDAIEVGLNQVDFRENVDKTFILVTDESFTPKTSTRRERRDLDLKEMLELDFKDIIQKLNANNIKTSILGIDDDKHKELTRATGGLWFQIPMQDNMP
ncbi:VWA domain-containing protein [Candidatus Poribacteria bacterium]|nr:VWA domain-containing protein [Candidatus Poribacteria bacterium]